MASSNPDRRGFLQGAAAFLAGTRFLAESSEAQAGPKIKPAETAKYLIYTPKLEWDREKLAQIQGDPEASRQVAASLNGATKEARRYLAVQLDFALRQEQKFFDNTDERFAKHSARVNEIRAGQEHDPRDRSNKDVIAADSQNPALKLSQWLGERNDERNKLLQQHDGLPIIGPLIARVRDGELSKEQALDAMNQIITVRDRDAHELLATVRPGTAPAPGTLKMG